MTEYDDKESLPFYSPGAYLLCYADKPWTKEDIAKMTTKLNEETEDEGTNGEETVISIIRLRRSAIMAELPPHPPILRSQQLHEMKRMVTLHCMV